MFEPTYYVEQHTENPTELGQKTLRPKIKVGVILAKLVVSRKWREEIMLLKIKIIMSTDPGAIVKWLR